MKKLLPLPANFDPEKHDAGHLHRWLEKQGIVIGGVTLFRPFKDMGDNRLVAEIEGVDELPETLVAFSDEPSAEERAEAELDNIDISKADLAQLRQAVGLMKSIMAKDKKKDS